MSAIHSNVDLAGEAGTGHINPRRRGGELKTKVFSEAISNTRLEWLGPNL